MLGAVGVMEATTFGPGGELELSFFSCDLPQPFFGNSKFQLNFLCVFLEVKPMSFYFFTMAGCAGKQVKLRLWSLPVAPWISLWASVLIYPTLWFWKRYHNHNLHQPKNSHQHTISMSSRGSCDSWELPRQ